MEDKSVNGVASIAGDDSTAKTDSLHPTGKADFG